MQRNPKCEKYKGQIDCDYNTILECEECKYGEGKKNPEAKCNQRKLNDLAKHPGKKKPIEKEKGIPVASTSDIIEARIKEFFEGAVYVSSIIGKKIIVYPKDPVITDVDSI